MKTDLPITAVWPGNAYPRGASWDGEGVNFAVFSQHAEKVELCLFDASGRHERQRITLPERVAGPSGSVTTLAAPVSSRGAARCWRRRPASAPRRT